MQNAEVELRYLQTERLKQDIRSKILMSDIEDVFDRPAFNQTAVKLLLDNVRMVKENTTRAVSSLETVLYLIRPMEKGDSLKFILGVCENTSMSMQRLRNRMKTKKFSSKIPAHRQIRINTLASNIGIFNRTVATLYDTGDWCGA